MKLRYLRCIVLLVSIVLSLIIVGSQYFGDHSSQQLAKVGEFGFSATHHTFLSTSSDGLAVWSWPELQRLRTLPIPSAGEIVVWSGDGARLARETGQTVEIWQVAEASRIANIPVVGYPERTFSRLYFNHTGTALARVTVDKFTRVQVWQLTQNSAVQEIPSSTFLPRLALSPDGQMIAFYAQNGIDIVRLTDQVQVQTLAYPTQHPVVMGEISYSPDGRFLAAVSWNEGQQIWVWQVAKGQFLTTLQGAHGAIKSLAFSPDNTLIAAGGGDSELGQPDTAVRLWRLTDSTLLHTFANPTYVRQIGFSPDGKMVAVNSWDGRTRFWSVQ